MYNEAATQTAIISNFHEHAVARNYFPGMGEAVADRTINRKIPDGSGGFRIEKWEDVARRVALGNALLVPGTDMNARRIDGEWSANPSAFELEYDKLHHHLKQASLLMSGRHLQHGEESQPGRNIEVFSNCTTAASTFILFYLLLNGSGVGRCYDDDMIKADLNFMPIVVPVIDWSHQDVAQGLVKGHLTLRDAQHLYAGRTTTIYTVPDSREGWAKAIEQIEVAAYEKTRRDDVLLIDFTQVRPKNSPIKGMQNRPASGPGPLMSAVAAIAKLRDAGMSPWRAAMYADHYAAECVLVGGARRAARMSAKTWRDKTIFEFIELKRGGFLWSSNNSVLIDQEFRDGVVKVRDIISEKFNKRIVTPGAVKRLLKDGKFTKLELHAYEVLVALADAAYHDGTGEPGLINQDRLTRNDEGIEAYADGLFAESAKMKLDPPSLALMRDLAKTALASRYTMLVNPCGEIPLFLLGGYCVLADVVPFYTADDNEAEDAFRVATRALIRVNLMDSLYKREVDRTNRIGVGITGLHEWIYKRFGYTWYDIVDEEKSKPMWLMLSRFKRAIVDESERYSKLLGVTVPHSNTTIKPAGCASLDTRIKTDSGVKSMLEIFQMNGITENELKNYAPGTWITLKTDIMVRDENDEEKVVTKLYVNGEKPVFEITMQDGTVAKLTGNHRLKTASGWKRVDELTTADEIIQFSNV